MGKAKSALRSQVEMLRRALSFIEKAKGRLNIVGVYVVGSRARGDYTTESDIDLVLISDDVKGLNPLERRLLLKDIIEPRVEFFIFTREEWENETDPWIRELRREARKPDELINELQREIDRG